jgi:hypothetical protein
MIALVREAYVRSWRFVRACPLVTAIVVAAEFGQHIIEINLGFYSSMANAAALAEAPQRLAAGHLKVLSIMLLGYGVTRFLGFGDDARKALRLEQPAVRMFAIVVAFELIWILIGLDGGAVLRTIGVAPVLAGRITGVLMVFGFLLGAFLIPWKVAAPLGNPAIGFVRSLQISWRHLPFALLFGFVPALPVMAVHYALFYGVVGRPPAVIWGAALLDAAVVGYLGALLATTSFLIARHITDRNGIALLPDR